MQTFSSRDVQTRFGAVMDIAKRDALTITHCGRLAQALYLATEHAEILVSEVTLACRDPKDDNFLAVAEAGRHAPMNAMP